MNKSHIVSSRGSEESFTDVLLRIKGADLPIVTEYKDGVMSFYHRNRCSNDIADSLENIIDGLMYLYQKE